MTDETPYKLRQLQARQVSPQHVPAPVRSGEVTVRKRVDSELQDFSPGQRVVRDACLRVASALAVYGVVFLILVKGTANQSLGVHLPFGYLSSGLGAWLAAAALWITSLMMENARFKHSGLLLEDAKCAIEHRIPKDEEIRFLAVPIKRSLLNRDVYVVTTRRILLQRGNAEPEEICDLKSEADLDRSGSLITIPDEHALPLEIREEFIHVAQPVMQMPMPVKKPKQSYATLMEHLGPQRRIPSGMESQFTMLPEHLQQEQHTQWPTPQDFNESIQTPSVSFADGGLKMCSPRLNAMGLPMPVTGAFASVYALSTNGTAWAVKCFLREVADQALRYRLIADSIHTCGLDCAIGFEFIEKGILVRKDWYPIVKMDWVEGASILDFIDAHCFDAEALEHIADEFLDLHLALAERGIAHGDLQHGNIIITEHGLRLVDYDGMFVNGMAGMMSNELGHRNYQHPRRDAHHFGPYIDNFSVWVIYLSLKILALAPELWEETGRGDECLLFKQQDFVDPNRSTLFKRLLGHGSPQLKKYWLFLGTICQLPFEQVPAPTGSQDCMDLLRLPTA